MDELDESTKTFRMVDDVFFVVKKCLRCVYYSFLFNIQMFPVSLPWSHYKKDLITPNALSDFFLTVNTERSYSESA